MTDIVLLWEVTRGMQVGIDIDSESDGYRLTVGDTRGKQVGIDLSNESDEISSYSGRLLGGGCRYVLI